MQTRATPGVYAIDRSSRVATGTRFCMPTLPPTCDMKMRSLTPSMRTPSTPLTAACRASPCASSDAWIVMSRVTASLRERTMSTPTTSPPASEMAASTLPSIPWPAGMTARMVRLWFA